MHQRGKTAGVWTEPGRAKGGDVSTPGCDTEKGVISQKGTRPAGDNKGLLFLLPRVIHISATLFSNCQRASLVV